MNATEWAAMFDALANESPDVTIDDKQARQLATLLRAMVAEREALARYANHIGGWGLPRENVRDLATAWGNAEAARRRAEGGG
jgi:hypothetical protein